MIIRNVTLADLEFAAREAGVRLLNPRKAGRGYRLRLGLIGETYRRYNGNRKVAAVCWHGHHSFMEQVFRVNPDAVIITWMARYDGADDFRAKMARYDRAGTYDRNIGSMMEPLYYGEACHCGEEED